MLQLRDEQLQERVAAERVLVASACLGGRRLRPGSALSDADRCQYLSSSSMLRRAIPTRRELVDLLQLLAALVVADTVRRARSRSRSSTTRRRACGLPTRPRACVAADAARTAPATRSASVAAVVQSNSGARSMPRRVHAPRALRGRCWTARRRLDAPARLRLRAPRRLAHRPSRARVPRARVSSCRAAARAPRAARNRKASHRSESRCERRDGVGKPQTCRRPDRGTPSIASRRSSASSMRGLLPST